MVFGDLDYTKFCHHQSGQINKNNTQQRLRTLKSNCIDYCIKKPSENLGGIHCSLALKFVDFCRYPTQSYFSTHFKNSDYPKNLFLLYIWPFCKKDCTPMV